MAANFWASSQSKTLMDADEYSRLEPRSDETNAGLTQDAISVIKMHLADHIKTLCQHKLRPRVVYTAIAYFRRVFVKKSMVEFDPRLVAVTSLYLASKAEESTVQARMLVDLMAAVKCPCGFGSLGYKMRDVLEMEMHLLHVLDYNLIVFHPHRPLSILLQDAFKSLELPTQTRDELRETAWSVVNDSLKTDLLLMYPPHVIAASCLHLASVIRDVDIHTWFEGLRIDMQVVRRISMTMLDLYQAFSVLTEERIVTSFRCLPPAPPQRAAAAAAAAAAGAPGHGGMGSTSR